MSAIETKASFSLKALPTVFVVLAIELIGSVFYVWQKAILLGWARLPVGERNTLFARSPDAAKMFSDALIYAYGARGFLIGITISAIGMAVVAHKSNQSEAVSTIWILATLVVPLI